MTGEVIHVPRGRGGKRLNEREAFRNGALAMQVRIVAILAAKGHMDLAPMVLGMDPPPYSEPEIMTLGEPAADLDAAARA